MELPYFALFLVRKYSRPHYRELFERHAKMTGHQWHELKDALAGEHAQKVANKLSEFLDAEEKFREAKAEIVALRELKDEEKLRKNEREDELFRYWTKARDQKDPTAREAALATWREARAAPPPAREGKQRTKEEWSALFGHFKRVIQKNEPIARNSFLELFKLVQPWGYTWERQLVADKIIESR
jgi:thioredoxin-like negative regulator of GroEL